MPDGGLDIATLGLRVDARPVTKAHDELDKFTAAGERAEAQSGRLAAATKRGFRESATAAREGAQAQVEAIEREYQLSEAAIKEAVARGFISPKEASKAGREAAQAYNRSLVQVIDRAQAAGGLNRNTKAGADAFVGLTNQLKNVDQAGRRAGLGLGRLNDAFVTVARQATGTSPVVGKLVDTVGTFALGTAFMVPVLAGIAAIGFAWQKMGEDARKAREEQDKAIESLLEAARLRSLGAAGSEADTLAAATARQRELERQLADLRAAPLNLSGASVGGGVEQGRIIAQANRDKDIAKLEAQLAEAAEAVEEGQRQIFENVSAANKALEAEQNRAADAALSTEERRTRGLARLAAETERVLAERARQETAAAEERARAAQDAAAEAERARQADAAALADRTASEFDVSLDGIQRYHDAVAEAEAESRIWRDAWVNAAFDVASAFGQSAATAAAFSANAVDAARLHLSGNRSAGASAALGSVGGFAGAAISSILDSRGERARAVEQARAQFERVLDDYVATLADRNRFEQLTADAGAGAQGALDAMVEALVADLATRGDFGAQAAQAIRDAIAKGIDAQGLEGILGQFGAEGQAILDAYREKLEQINALREKEIAAAEQSLRVRELIAQGRDEEAAALERENANRQAIKEALELGGKALADYTRRVQEQEEATRQAAEAERARTEALERSRQATQDRFSVEGREAALAGDDRGAFAARLAGDAFAEQAALDDRFTKGEIEIDLYRRLSAVIDGEVIKALRDFDEAAAESKRRIDALAEAERFRSAQAQRSLDVELLLAQGRDDEAFLKQQQIRLLQAENDGKDEQYLATLRQLQAQQLANRAADKAAETAKKQADAQDELTRALDGGLRVLGGPAGFTAQVQAYRNQALRYGGSTFGTPSPDFSGGTNNTFEITIQTQPGQDNLTIGQQVYDQIVAEVQRRNRLGGFNRIGGF